MAPLDRIRKAVGPEKAAAFDRAMVALADRVEQIVAMQEGGEPALRPRFHAGHLVEVEVESTRRFA